MDLQPWDYYDAKLQPKGNTAEIVSTLESVMKRNPDHAGALHLYVHAVEASADPQRGVAAADRLRTLIPGSGHLVHMPAHIYARVGRWHDAVLANQIAIAADDAYLAICRGKYQGVYPLGYVPHNHHFLWFAATMEGASEIAQRGRRADRERTRRPAGADAHARLRGLQHYWMTPLVRRRALRPLGRDRRRCRIRRPTCRTSRRSGTTRRPWRRVRQEPRSTTPRQHLAELAKLAGRPGCWTRCSMWDRYPLATRGAHRRAHAAAEIAPRAGDLPGRHRGAAARRVQIEDTIPYDEPPGWHAPVRQTLGAVLLAAKLPAEAEAVYREELQRNPRNGWSLYGLAQALRAQGRRSRGDRCRQPVLLGLAALRHQADGLPLLGGQWHQRAIGGLRHRA